ncbi:lactate utilization protein C [Deinococcus antarcticus]|uniref:Lactate utilization protein C n=1 Tax=Deinococcus antarcticus TaxID=1298767 RepID=A0ABV8ABG5_9DEIO
MTTPPSPFPSSAEARLEMLTTINRAIAGAQAEPLPPYPQAAPLSQAEMLHQFQDRILDYKAAYRRVSAAELPGAITEALAGAARVLVPAGFPPEWLSSEIDVLRDDPPLSNLELNKAGAVLTGCAVAISETGTIILDHQGNQGRRALSLIPDIHVCIVRENQIVQTVPEGVRAVAASVRAGHPLTWISGGSATSDIELVRVEGVHGPRHLQVIVVSD